MRSITSGQYVEPNHAHKTNIIRKYTYIHNLQASGDHKNQKKKKTKFFLLPKKMSISVSLSKSKASCFQTEYTVTNKLMQSNVQ